ncbi:aminotransferase class I/II-fold pyridoxal phosphate-dependent enzyme [Thalassococcus sp. CAU 1522]|uniref:Aminotransferase class I/II-fold pyridoxal phosphate-dependent enzyme n=1 Tax=Thalassococcus arenae TaxID=2851652 RepID=A0ABS6N8A8_9RHOB|nr:aminotransferase class I/II-fold pyridoxal phosphate-dependent enzyme [Thalassococcus arenae]MBV2360256.1 aminotransferase class I/II-fold pyridoxal phosphate-dependent enzyme [Thalassococcus arenae]
MLERRDWVPAVTQAVVDRVAGEIAGAASGTVADRIDALAAASRRIHERDCFNLNPATNVMNPRAEALLASGLGVRPSLGHPGDKYETGLEAVEEIEVIAAELASEVFGARFVELRVASGAMANLYAFMALTRPGDTVLVPPACIGGHVTHHGAGCAGLYGLRIVEAPVDAAGYTLDLDGLRALARAERPKLITLGGSLNLWPHDVGGVVAVAREVGARVLFDAAHQCGIIAGGVWDNPLAQGADVMTMSTYKSLGGPPAGLVLTGDAAIAERLEAIAYPGMTANFDAAKTAALAMGLLDWRDFGADYARAMVATAQALAAALAAQGLAVFGAARGFTASHQFALEAAPLGGGQAAAKRLRAAGFLACGIGLPLPAVPGDLNGLRLGTPEIVRWGMGVADMERLAGLIAAALRSNDPAALAPEVAAWRATFDRVHFVHGAAG